MAKMTDGCPRRAIRFDITGEPMMLSHGHCAICREAIGAPFITWITLATDDFAYTQDGSAICRSSAIIKRNFCGQCDTTLAYASDDYCDELDIAAGAPDDPAQIPPDDHIRVNGMLPWLKFDDTLSCLPGSHWEHGYPDRN